MIGVGTYAAVTMRISQDVSLGANLSALLHFYSLTAINWLGCSQSALLHVSPPLQLCNALCQTSHSLSARLQRTCSSVFCHAIHL